jgi:hypothetical protein
MSEGKIRRWAERLTDDQIFALVTAFEQTLARKGMSGAPLREVLVRFVAEHPSPTGPLRRATDRPARQSD